MRPFFLSAVLLSIFLNMAKAMAQNADSPANDGMTVQQLREFSESLEELPAPIQAIRFFRPDGRERSVALTTNDQKTGWQIFVFDSVPSSTRFALTWKSGKLDDGFSVSYPGALKLFDFGHEQGIEFEGCAPHVCPDVFSVLLYVPSKRTAFTAKYVWGKITYSPESSENSGYKAALDQLITARTDQ